MTVFKRAIHLGSMNVADNSSDLFPRLRDLVVAAEQSGFDAVLVADHLIQGPIGGGAENPIIEANTLLAALAARTETIRLGALVSPVTTHNPAHFAKTVTALDVVSGGRAILGLGAGWDADESAAYGIPFPGVGERMDRLEEALTICKLMMTEDKPVYTGRFFEIHEPRNIPRPIGPIPFLVGGGGEKRTLRIVAQHADACNIDGDVENISRKFGILDEHLAAVGRDPAEVQKTAALPRTGDLDDYRRAVEERIAIGATGVVGLVDPDRAVVEARGKILLDLLP